MNDPGRMPFALASTRALAVGATLALIALGLAWELWLAPTGRGTLAIKVLPLFIPLPGLMRAKLYTYRWMTLAIWPWFIEGVVRASGDRGLGAPLGATEAVLSLLVFVACMLHVRARQQPAGSLR